MTRHVQVNFFETLPEESLSWDYYAAGETSTFIPAFALLLLLSHFPLFWLYLEDPSRPGGWKGPSKTCPFPVKSTLVDNLYAKQRVELNPNTTIWCKVIPTAMFRIRWGCVRRAPQQSLNKGKATSDVWKLYSLISHAKFTPFVQQLALCIGFTKRKGRVSERERERERNMDENSSMFKLKIPGFCPFLLPRFSHTLSFLPSLRLNKCSEPREERNENLGCLNLFVNFHSADKGVKPCTRRECVSCLCFSNCFYLPATRISQTRATYIATVQWQRILCASCQNKSNLTTKMLFRPERLVSSQRIAIPACFSRILSPVLTHMRPRLSESHTCNFPESRAHFKYHYYRRDDRLECIFLVRFSTCSQA